MLNKKIVFKTFAHGQFIGTEKKLVRVNTRGVQIYIKNFGSKNICIKNLLGKVLGQ